MGSTSSNNKLAALLAGSNSFLSNPSKKDSALVQQTIIAPLNKLSSQVGKMFSIRPNEANKQAKNTLDTCTEEIKKIVSIAPTEQTRVEKDEKQEVSPKPSNYSF